MAHIDKVFAQIFLLKRFATELKTDSAEMFLDELDALKDSCEAYVISHPEKTDYEVPHHGAKINLPNCL